LFHRLAPEVELRQLRREHARAIHDLYPANDMEAIEAFEKCIEALPAYGIFVKSTASTNEIQKKIENEDHLDDDDENIIPAAWMVQSYYGAMFSMQTLPEFRRKGYGILLASRLTAAVRQRGYIPFVVIRPENSASQSLYLKLGFKKIYSTIRAVLKPNKTFYNNSEILLPTGANNLMMLNCKQNGGTKTTNGCCTHKINNDKSIHDDEEPEIIEDNNIENDENEENIIKENGNLFGEVVEKNEA
jgi:GNAT superfamily N-acetyltransferase